MKIDLIDVDSHNYPNLPLMKLSVWHKSQGDSVEYHEYHCGDGIEYYFYDDWDEKYKWRASRIEHNEKRYYIVGNPNIELNGLRVRHRKL